MGWGGGEREGTGGGGLGKVSKRKGRRNWSVMGKKGGREGGV